MDGLVSKLILLTLCYVFVTGSKPNIKTVHQPYGFQMCRKLWKVSKSTFLFSTKDLSCNRVLRRADYAHNGSTCKKERKMKRKFSLTVITAQNICYTEYRVSNGGTCSRNEDCFVKGSVCFAGRCLCRLGLYFSPKENTCLRECFKYGDKMVIYKGAGIVGYNKKTVTAFTVKSCLKKCVREKSFKCLTAEKKRSDTTCLLSSHGYLDVTNSCRQHNNTNYIFAQRQCK